MTNRAPRAACRPWSRAERRRRRRSYARVPAVTILLAEGAALLHVGLRWLDGCEALSLPCTRRTWRPHRRVGPGVEGGWRSQPPRSRANAVRSSPFSAAPSVAPRRAPGRYRPWRRPVSKGPEAKGRPILEWGCVPLRKAQPCGTHDRRRAGHGLRCSLVGNSALAARELCPISMCRWAARPPSRLFRRPPPPARIRPPRTTGRRTGVQRHDQAHADRQHARGRNPRRRAGR